MDFFFLLAVDLKSHQIVLLTSVTTSQHLLLPSVKHCTHVCLLCPGCQSQPLPSSPSLDLQHQLHFLQPASTAHSFMTSAVNLPTIPLCLLCFLSDSILKQCTCLAELIMSPCYTAFPSPRQHYVKKTAVSILYSQIRRIKAMLLLMT